MVSSSIAGTNVPEVPKESTATHAGKPYPWIINPVFDFIFITGGGVLVLMAINYQFLGWSVPVDMNANGLTMFLIITMFLTQHIFADSHNTATYMRIWGSKEDRKRFKFYRTWLAYSIIPIFVLGLSKPEFTSSLVYLYLITVFWHYAAQAFGIALIYCYKRGYIMNNVEKEIFRWFILSMSGYVIIRFLTFQDFSPRNFYGVPIPFWGPLPLVYFNAARLILICMAIAFVGVVLKKAIMDKKIMPIPSLLLIITVACLGLSSGTANSMMWFYVPGFYHGSQYLAVCLAYYLKERGMPEGMDTWKMSREVIRWPAVKYIGTVILTGCFFYVGIPHFFMQMGLDFGMVGGLVLGCVNYHHFITDAAIWRLRDNHCRKILLS
ncbi:hypothetical protein KF707_13110 [Candidatus Obscuribacterales bacterium]|nr:hypothetical protein [Candidatus Obscuribacterales bacterium]MBX3137174.1 hypothetical protein [Candidatus Obscuribacterales bacterium]MBX3153944.1 hypothetical protein [Candidatus Obscuribacterales bacterium]